MKAFILKRWNRWVDRRIPRSDVQRFTQKNIFILPSGAGTVFGVLLLVMLITGINYQNSLIYLITFVLGAVFVGAMHQTHRNLSGLEVTLLQPGEAVAGDEVLFRFRAAAGCDNAVGIVLSCEGSSLGATHILAREAKDLTVPVASVHRGYLRPDRIRIETRFPFGLLKAWSWVRPASAAIISPRPVAPPEVVTAVEGGDESENAVATAGNDHADLRPWREGDMNQRVMWKRYARNGQMVVADWEGEQGSSQWLDFNAFPGTDNELRLSYLAWLVNERGRSGGRFGLSLPGQVVEPDFGPAQVHRCLSALAVWGLEPPAGASPEHSGNRTLAQSKAAAPAGGAG